MTDHYDDIVIGSGSAGGTLAARLSEDPDRRVLLIEGGPDYAEEKLPPEILDGSGPCTTSHDWGYTADIGLAGRTTFPYLRGKIIGGTSSINTAMGLRGMRADFAQWAELGLPEWSWDKVEPYFVKLETDTEGEGPAHGTDGPIVLSRNNGGFLRPIQTAFVNACAELGYKAIGDLNNPDVDADETVGRVPMNVRDADNVRISTAIGYLSAAKERPNLNVVADHLVDRVLISDGVATGVVTHHDDVEHVYSADRITISAGTFGTPAILLRSGVGPADELDELGIAQTVDLPGVGMNLMDHFFAPVSVKPVSGVCSADDPQVQMLLRYTSEHSGSDPMMTNDMQLLMLSNLDMGGKLHFEADETPLIPALYVGVQKPYSRGRVSIVSPDPEVQPRVDLAFLSDPRDRQRMVEGLGLAVKLAETAAFSKVADGYVNFSPAMLESEVDTNEYLDANLMPGFHASGTARMGPIGDPLAVIDQHFRVHGVPNLRVVDASAMPDIVRANPNLSIIMMGERAADFIKGDVGQAT